MLLFHRINTPYMHSFVIPFRDWTVDLVSRNSSKVDITSHAAPAKQQTEDKREISPLCSCGPFHL